jgi:hypothetical protein
MKNEVVGQKRHFDEMFLDRSQKNESVEEHLREEIMKVAEGLR